MRPKVAESMADSRDSKGSEEVPKTVPLPYSVHSITSIQQHPPSPLGTMPMELGSYQLTDLLGRGGMGMVYKAWDASLERHAAVKVLAPELRVYPEALERLKIEARAAARLKHPGIVQVYALGEQDGWSWIAMEYVEGSNLARVVKDGGPLPVAKALRYTRQAAEALAFAARERIVHRDVKPENIMITPQDEARVMDFGLARRLDSDVRVTSTGATPGTPSFMAPEQALARDIDQRTDIYSLGCTLYNLLAGRPPFSGNSAMEVIMHHVNTPMPIPETWRAIAQGRLATLIERMTKKDPNDRYHSWEDVLAQIAEIEVALSGSSMRRTLPPPREGRPAWLMPVAIGGGVLAVAAAAYIAKDAFSPAALPPPVPITRSLATPSATPTPAFTPELAVDATPQGTPFMTDLRGTPPGPPPPRPEDDPRVQGLATAMQQAKWDQAIGEVSGLPPDLLPRLAGSPESIRAELMDGLGLLRDRESQIVGADFASKPVADRATAIVNRIETEGANMKFEDAGAAILYLTAIGDPRAHPYAAALFAKYPFGPDTARGLHVLIVTAHVSDRGNLNAWRELLPRPGSGPNRNAPLRGGTLPARTPR